ncbi:MAG: hypothetical protein GW949_08645 [Spirochaetales bacterium]|nr:hypothetical protein [Spirochaetales bacterium]
MKADPLGLPTIIVPYPGPAPDDESQDLFVYLRPETNGVLVESTLLRVIKNAGLGQPWKLVYMANFPGEFIVRNKIVEQYYAVKLHFAVAGRWAFSDSMRHRFNQYFQVDFNRVPVLGSFEALEVLGKTPEELFSSWVEAKDMTILNGQTIKKIEGSYIVNYDIPALMHKNEKGTDIAVMIFRTRMDYQGIKSLVARMWEALVAGGILKPQHDASRAFHHSKSPFEQTLDAITYLFANDRKTLRLKDFTFPKYLMGRGIPEEVICGLMRNPIVSIREPSGRLVEDSVFSYGNNFSFAQAYDLVTRIESQIPLIHHGPLIDDICRGCLD